MAISQLIPSCGVRPGDAEADNPAPILSTHTLMRCASCATMAQSPNGTLSTHTLMRCASGVPRPAAALPLSTHTLMRCASGSGWYHCNGNCLSTHTLMRCASPPRPAVAGRRSPLNSYPHAVCVMVAAMRAGYGSVSQLIPSCGVRQAESEDRQQNSDLSTHTLMRCASLLNKAAVFHAYSQLIPSCGVRRQKSPK